jgi:hypothetical protein
MKFKYKDAVTIIDNPFYNGVHGRIVSFKKGNYSYNLNDYENTYVVDVDGNRLLFPENELEAK